MEQTGRFTQGAALPKSGKTPAKRNIVDFMESAREFMASAFDNQYVIEADEQDYFQCIAAMPVDAVMAAIGAATELWQSSPVLVTKSTDGVHVECCYADVMSDGTIYKAQIAVHEDGKLITFSQIGSD